MKLKVEAVIDIDSRRRAIIAGDVDEVGSKEFENVARYLSQAVTTQALTATAIVRGEVGEPEGADIARAAGAEPLAPSQRPKRPDDPETMRAFGEDEEED